ncbi:MAG: hypothetical protein LQ338_005003 [Usnochroma carphineum]|nr:MAG: hypothetical protein LQ338_005003 [Usnochroma carphineum]
MTTNSTAVSDTLDDATAASLRSRASSIITTTTKFSLETLSQDDRSSILAIQERQRPGAADRPRSLLSMTSVARPAPPYTATLDSMLLLPTHQNGDFQPAANPPPEIQAPEKASSINEAIPPPSLEAAIIPSAASATASPPDSPPLDPDNPSAQITYYNHVVRTLDQNYTAELDKLRAQHAQELATTRHDIDAAYRAQWKAKNREIERIREEAAVEIEHMRKECEARISALETEVGTVQAHLEQRLLEKEEEKQGAVQKARHEIEDMWEKRWSDRTRVENEERKRLEEAHRKEMDRAVAAEGRKQYAKGVKEADKLLRKGCSGGG